VDAELDPLDQADDAVGEVPGVGRRADLVADNGDLAPGLGQLQHRVDEVAAAEPEEAGRADDEVALVRRGDSLLAGELGAAVGRKRRRLVALHVRRALEAVEDIVGGDVENARFHLRGRSGDVAGAAAVDGEGGLLGRLGTVDVGPGGAVDDDVGPLEVELAVERPRVGDVELGAAVADDVVAGVAGGEEDVASQHPGGSGDEQLHLASSGVSTGSRLAIPARRRRKHYQSAATAATGRPVSDARSTKRLSIVITVPPSCTASAA
jgi:hypothetical protein